MNVYYSKNIEVADFSNGRVKHAVKESSSWWLKRVLEVTIWSKQIMFMDCLWTTYIFMICNMIYSIFRVNDHATLTWKVFKGFFQNLYGHSVAVCGLRTWKTYYWTMPRWSNKCIPCESSLKYHARSCSK